MSDSNAVYTEKYLTKSSLVHILAACRYSFEKLDLYILDEGFDIYSQYIFEVKEKWSLYGSFISPPINRIYIEIKEFDYCFRVTVNVNYGYALGPWCKNKGTKIGKELIRTVKLAECSNLTPELAQYNLAECSNLTPELAQYNLAECSNLTPEIAENNLEPEVHNASESSRAIDDYFVNYEDKSLNSIPEPDDQNKVEPSLDEKLKKEILLEVEQFKKYVVLDDNETKKYIYESNLELVNQIARKYTRFINRDLSFQDLIKEGSVGLRTAVEKYDSSVHEFLIFAYLYIKKYIEVFIQAKRNEDPTYFPNDVQLRGKKSSSKQANKAESSTSNVPKSDSKADEFISEADALKNFSKLKDEGIITEEEFNAKKKQILGL